jgi:hypothetical protein
VGGGHSTGMHLTACRGAGVQACMPTWRHGRMEACMRVGMEAWKSMEMCRHVGAACRHTGVEVYIPTQRHGSMEACRCVGVGVYVQVEA